MLVPSRQLILLTALVVLPAATVAGVVPEAAGLALAVIALFALVATGDALRSIGILHDLEFSIPDVVRLTQDREGVLPIQIRSTTPRALPLRAAIALPDSFSAQDWIRSAVVPASGEPVILDWSVRSPERGRHPLALVRVETPSPHGLWAVRRTVRPSTKVLVYPDLLRDRRTVAAVFLNRSGVGIHARRQVGQGREFEKLRDYSHGDPVGDIHWKATAKRGRPVSKVFQIERTQEVYVVLDTSRLTGRSHGRETDFERSLRAGLLLAAAAERQGDLFGVVAFDSKVRHFVRTGRGRPHFTACREALFALQPRSVTPDFAEVCTTLRLRLRRRALLVFLTALDDPVLAEDFTRAVRLLSGQHLVVALQPRPAGARPLFSGPAVATTDDLYSALGSHVRWQKLRLLEEVLRASNVRFTLPDSESLAPAVLRQYLDLKQRQLL
ncbi:MAG: DUF58 domain-containing protein [Verrucomicrobiales bacterium]|nr:DUF58 domain-containing protein [Verrucomicrobiales bacterium]